MTPEEQEDILRRAEEMLMEARNIINNKGPYYAPTVYGFIPYPAWGYGTIGVTKGMVLVYDPEWVVNKCTDESLAGALVHESEHVIRDHHARGEDFEDKATANKAMDCPINSDILHAGWSLPHYVVPSTFGLPEGLTFEEYYDLLKNGEQKKEQNKTKGSSPKQEKGQENQKDSSGDESGDTPEDGTEPAEKEPSVASGGCGGIAGNPGAGSIEEIADAEVGRSGAEVKVIAKATMNEIKNHIAQNGRGSVPGHLVEGIENSEKEKSKIPWTRELAHIIKKASGRIEAGGMDFSMARPSKRSTARGIPRPGLVQYQPEVAFIIDTSGSMGVPQLIMCIVQIVAILKTLGLDAAHIIQSDTDVTDKKKVRLRDLMGTIDFTGRGGTDFDAGLRAADSLNPRPDLIFYLTDGDGACSYKPKAQVVWCVVPSYWNKPPEVSWGHVVIIGDDGKKKKKA